MDDSSHRRHLIHILQLAYSGEKAAAFAYRGHWKASKDLAERERIAAIEAEEWAHRRRVGEILQSLGGRPRRLRELALGVLGRVLGLFCHLSGWFLPMFFAGRLETQNVDEYQTAAFHAISLGLHDFERDLLHMRDVEKEHEVYFLGAIENHRWLPWMKKIFRT